MPRDKDFYNDVKMEKTPDTSGRWWTLFCYRSLICIFVFIVL
jgi:hypothetical protein